MEIFAVLLVAYLVASPDRVSLALSRGITGGVRGAVTGKTPKSRKPSPRRRAFADGWREGVMVARQRREAGRDLWSRGTRGAGRLYGGTTSVVGGARRVVQGLRGRVPVGELEEGTTSSPDAVPARRGWSIARLVKRPRTAPTSEGTTERTGTEQADTKPDAPVEPAAAKPERAPAAPESKQEPANPAPADATSKTPEKATEPAPDAPAGAPDTSSNPSQIGVIHMPDTKTELTNIDQLDKYLKGLQNVFTDLTEASNRVKQSGKHLASQWEGNNWGTRALDRAISDICEEIEKFKVPSADTFASGRRAIAAARAVGETVETAKARGATEAFTGN